MQRIISYTVLYEESAPALAERIKITMLPLDWRPQGGVSVGPVICTDGVTRTVWAQALVRYEEKDSP